jgi:hypothetical protein
VPQPDVGMNTDAVVRCRRLMSLKAVELLRV